MEVFNKISIEEISKKDLYMIIEALDYTGKSTNNNDYLELKSSMLNQLCSLAEVSEDDFLKILQD